MEQHPCDECIVRAMCEESFKPRLQINRIDCSRLKEFHDFISEIIGKINESQTNKSV